MSFKASSSFLALVTLLIINTLVRLSEVKVFLKAGGSKVNNNNNGDFRPRINWSEENIDSKIIQTYLDFRAIGWTQENITTKIFKPYFPNWSLFKNQCYPFLCGNALMSSADVVIKYNTLWNTRRFEDGDVIFVGCKSVPYFTSAIFPRMNTTFILVYNNCDDPMPINEERVLLMLNSPMLLMWFVVNPSPKFGSHPKLTAIPRGIRQNEEYIQILEDNLRKAPDLYTPSTLMAANTSKRELDERPYLTYVSFFMDDARSNRKIYAKHFSKMKTSRWDETTVSTDEFMETVAKSKFVVSPVGVGMDCYRTYESILLGAIPIVDDISPKMTQDIFRNAPTYILDRNWQEHKPTEQDLLSFEADTSNGRKVALAQYWLDKIDKYRFQAKGMTYE